MVYINIYEDITNALEYYNLTFDDVILIGNSGGYIDKIKFIKLAQNTDYNDIENGNIIDIKMISKINSRINYWKRQLTKILKSFLFIC